jgi:hypothetical protein
VLLDTRGLNVPTSGSLLELALRRIVTFSTLSGLRYPGTPTPIAHHVKDGVYFSGRSSYDDTCGRPQAKISLSRSTQYLHLLTKRHRNSSANTETAVQRSRIHFPNEEDERQPADVAAAQELLHPKAMPKRHNLESCTAGREAADE